MAKIDVKAGSEVALMRDIASSDNSLETLLPVLENLPEPFFAVDNAYSPIKDEYFAQVVHVRRCIANFAAKHNPRVIKIAKLLFIGDKLYKEIAVEVGCSFSHVKRIASSSVCKEVMGMLHLLRIVEDGATEKQRLHMLWRIATDTEKSRPKTAIAAIGEMNKMQGLNGSRNLDSGFTVIINNAVLGRGALD